MSAARVTFPRSETQVVDTVVIDMMARNCLPYVAGTWHARCWTSTAVIDARKTCAARKKGSGVSAEYSGGPKKLHW